MVKTLGKLVEEGKIDSIEEENGYVIPMSEHNQSKITHERFGQILNDRQRRSREVLMQKAVEYSPGNDRLHNFKMAAAGMGVTTPMALWGMYIKHHVSLQDMTNGIVNLTPELINEKIGDAINYLHLLEAAFLEELEK